jgi:hypothetical protein
MTRSFAYLPGCAVIAARTPGERLTGCLQQTSALITHCPASRRDSSLRIDSSCRPAVLLQRLPGATVHGAARNFNVAILRAQFSVVNHMFVKDYYGTSGTHVNSVTKVTAQRNANRERGRVCLLAPALLATARLDLDRAGSCSRLPGAPAANHPVYKISCSVTGSRDCSTRVIGPAAMLTRKRPPSTRTRRSRYLIR